MRLARQPFESSICGFAVQRLELRCGQDPDTVAHVLKADPARLVMCRISAGNVRDAGLLRDLGFVEVEQLVTFEQDIGNESEAPEFISAGDASAAEACADIARRSFRYDRFHADPVMPRRLADEIKAAWARNNALGRADRCLVVCRNGGILGFSQCCIADGRAVIDLIAVTAEAQGQGLGRALVNASMAAYRARSRRMRAGTQAANFPSLALYRGLGMHEVSRAMTFHRWAR